MAGRKPLGPALVDHMDGSSRAKERLELILQTLAGQVTVVAACRRLDLSEAMFYKLRNRVLRNCLDDLEPKPRGRPPQLQSQEQQRSAELAAEVTALQRELTVQSVRLDLAQALPQLVKPTSQGRVKKTTRRAVRKRKRKK